MAWEDFLLYNKEFGWPLSLVPGGGGERASTFFYVPGDRSVFVIHDLLS